MIEPLGFVYERGRREFSHPETEHHLEFPAGPLAFGENVVSEDDATVIQTAWGPGQTPSRARTAWVHTIRATREVFWVSRRTVPIVAAVLIVAGLVGLASTWMYLGSSDQQGWPTTRNVDAMFIEEMIPHHEDAIAMARLARTEAEHPEIRRLASDIERTQTAEIAQMRAWYLEWFDSEVPEGGSSFGMMSGGVDMEDFEASEPFDKAFIEEMIPHHEMALMMSTMLSRRSDRAEMQALAESIIDTQSREIDQMRAWYSEWYGR